MTDAYTPPPLSDYYALGQQAAREGQPLSSRPNELSQPQAIAWFDGWLTETEKSRAHETE